MKKVTLIIISILFAGCSKPDDPTFIEGVVTNGITKEPIEGAEISASEITGGILDLSPYPDNPGEATTFSKEDGSYQLELASSESAEYYELFVSKSNYCRRYVQSVEAGKTHHFDMDMYEKSIVNRVYMLHDKADSIVEIYNRPIYTYSESECSGCFVTSYDGNGNCFSDTYGFTRSIKKQSDEVWNELSFSEESFQGLKFSMSYEIYGDNQVLKKDTLTFSLEQEKFTIEIAL